jgi:DNA/RNA endonuclease G (NUC1)
VNVTMEAMDGSALWSTFVNLTQAEGTATSYLADTQRIGYGSTGFETFTFDIPDSLRGKIATVKFDLNSTKTVYLDNIFFKSQNLIFSNPSNARKPDDAEFMKSNYLLEKPQYAVSYNKENQTANWVSYQLNRSWIGGGDKRNFSQDLELPLNWYKVKSDDYTTVDAFPPYARGHLAALVDRNRNDKDKTAVNLMSNIIPHHTANNSGLWETLENDLRNFVRFKGKELYIIAGTSPGNKFLESGDIKINVPNQVWKVVLVLDQPGAGVSDVGRDTLVHSHVLISG